LQNLSYSRGATAPLLEKTVAQALADAAARFPDREAIVVCHQKVRYTWSELDREVTCVARGLAGLGLAPGDRAGIWASNCIEWILMQYAAARAGVVLVNVNPAYRSHELRYVLQKSRIRALFLREHDARANYRVILDESRNGDALPLEHVIWLGGTSWDAMLAGGREFPSDTTTPHDIANIQYTSGTTGSPKGVLLTHHNLLNNGMAISLALRASEQDRICAPVPLYHCFGSVIGSMVSVVTGAALILPSAQFDALATLEAVHQERATAL
jgi:fatty-acyl-CoA synthase